MLCVFVYFAAAAADLCTHNLGSSNTEDIILIKTQSADFDYFFVNPNFLAIGHIPDLGNCC